MALPHTVHTLIYSFPISCLQQRPLRKTGLVAAHLKKASYHMVTDDRDLGLCIHLIVVFSTTNERPDLCVSNAAESAVWELIP